MTHDGGVDDGQYADCLAALGEPRLYEISTIVGYYATLALQLRTFGLDTGPGDSASTETEGR